MSSKVLPSDEASFHIHVKEGLRTKKEFKGDFVCRLSTTIKEDLKIASIKSRICQGEELDDYNDLLAEGLAKLSVVTEESPKWWKDSDMGFELRDHNVLIAVITAYNKASNKYFEELYGNQEDVKIERNDESQE